MPTELLAMINQDPFLLFFGSFYIGLGLSIILSADIWREFIKLYTDNDSISLVMGIMTLPISLFIIVFFNSWDGNAASLLMIIGYIGFLKALALMLRPSLMQKVAECECYTKHLWSFGVLGVAIGGALLIL